jgi:hypothetical protein
MQKIRKILEFGVKNLKFIQIRVYEHQYPYDINLSKLPFRYFFSIYLKTIKR